MRTIILLAMIAALSVPRFARATDLIGDTKIPYSADRTVIWKDKHYTGKLFAEPGRQRHEQAIDGVRVWAILRADQRMAYLILPDLKLYTALPFPDAVTAGATTRALGPPVDHQMMQGEPAAEYRVRSHGDDGTALDGTIWLTEDGIPLRIEGSYADPGQAPHQGTLLLANIRKGSQPAGLFELPAGMNEVSERTVEGMFTLRMPQLK